MPEPLDISVKEEENKKEKAFVSKAKEFGGEAIRKAREAGETVLRVTRNPAMGSLEDEYVREKTKEAEAKRKVKEREREQKIKKIERRRANLLKRYRQYERALAAGRLSNVQRRSVQYNHDKFRKALRDVDANLKRNKLEQEQANEKAKRGGYKNEAEMRTAFRNMSDEQKVEFAKQLDRKGNTKGQEFLNETVRSGEDMNMTVQSQRMAQEYLGKGMVKADARDLAEANRNDRNNNLGSVLDNAERDDRLKQQDAGVDIRKSFAVKDSARSVDKTEKHVDRKPANKVVQRDNTEMTRSL